MITHVRTFASFLRAAIWVSVLVFEQRNGANKNKYYGDGAKFARILFWWFLFVEIHANRCNTSGRDDVTLGILPRVCRRYYGMISCDVFAFDSTAPSTIELNSMGYHDHMNRHIRNTNNRKGRNARRYRNNIHLFDWSIAGFCVAPPSIWFIPSICSLERQPHQNECKMVHILPGDSIGATIEIACVHE